MGKLLDSKNFGGKLYDSLPPMYRVDDATVNYALKRYLEALAEGGFAQVIDEINSLLSLVDPDKVDAELLPLLFQHYGLEVFNGIPELYLRKLLPSVSKLFSLKGSITSVEFITSLVSGVKSTIDIDESDMQEINVRMELDYESNALGVVPDEKQLIRIIKEFIPFFCNVTIVYVYLYLESQNIESVDEEGDTIIHDTKYENGALSVAEELQHTFLKEFALETGSINRRKGKRVSTNSVFQIGAYFGNMIFNDFTEVDVDEYRDLIKTSLVSEDIVMSIDEKDTDVLLYPSEQSAVFTLATFGKAVFGNDEIVREVIER